MNTPWVEMNVKNSHAHNNNHRLHKLTKKKPTIRLTTRVTMLWAPKGPFFTGSWSQLRSSARHTLSNQQAQVKQPETC